MRVLFTIFPATAHLHAIVPLAWALRSAGHEVVVACQADALDQEVITSIGTAGLTAVPLDVPQAPPSAQEQEAALQAAKESLAFFADAWRFDPAEPAETGTWRGARDLLTGMFDLYYPVPEQKDAPWPVLDDLVEFTRAWRPDLVLWDPLMFPSAVAARAVDAAHARLVWGTDAVAVCHERTKREMADPSSGLAEHPWRTSLGRMMERYGFGFDDEAVLGQWTLDLTLPRFRAPVDLAYVPIRRVPYNGAGPLPTWLHGRPERPRVALTLGVSRRMVFGESRGFPMRAFFDSVSDLDVEVVATLNSGQLAAVGAVPDNVRTVPYVPLDQLLPTSSAVVHHGGPSTLGAAVAHRVPQLVVPLSMWDEPFGARYVADRGAGLVCDAGALDVDDLRKQLARLLEEPSFRLGAQALYEETLAAPAPRDVVPILERLTAERR
ncbi:nucleotide disphospho-sugar-binding domain-containing protein [Streptomyces dysideae]|uniref:Uncharacterized protein n=1 Tax=Streptomyces dysideae TaxID=909626 RepID=A0A117S2J9_9ACTN|nr:nucleotide disphospho-sugar-binding domain-containing protein [Streptomyces dysideae]KUO22594.1 hypothetical protein AQJ91_03020 [Streptomyces dysideae]